MGDIPARGRVTTGASVSGMDVLRGNEGRDFLFGGAGNDALAGGDPADHEGYSQLEKPWGKWQDEDVIQGNTGNDVIVGNDFSSDGSPAKVENIDRGFCPWCDGPSCWGTDTGASDTVDYSMVPPDDTNQNTRKGLDVDLGDNTAGGYPVVYGSYDGEGGTDHIYGIENVVGTRSAESSRAVPVATTRTRITTTTCGIRPPSADGSTTSGSRTPSGANASRHS